MMTTKARQHGTLLSMTAMATILGGLSSYTQATTQMYYVHNDHLGTPIVMTDQSQTVVWEGNKNPFGEMVTAGSVGEHSRFPGQVFDKETGLHYNYIRDYDPALGRYIQSDSIGLQAGLNTYGYALQNPIIYTDPTGEVVPALIACAANPVCAGAVRAGVGALIGGLSATVGALSDPCFDGNLAGVIGAGALVGGASSFIPGTGALAGAAARGGVAGFGGNTVGQFAANSGANNFSFSQAATSGVIGAAALASGNVVGLQSALTAYRGGASTAQALAIGGSLGSAVSVLVGTAGSLGQSVAQNDNSSCGCNKP